MSKVVAMVTSLVLLIAGSVSGSGDSGDAPIGPGPGYARSTDGYCAGLWSRGPGSPCVHGSAQPTLEDDFTPYSTAYIADTFPIGGVPRYCDTSLNRKWVVIYAQTVGRENRYESQALWVRDRSERADYLTFSSAYSKEESRHIRYVCDNNLIRVRDESTLPNNAANNFGNLRDALVARGYDSNSRKYLVWADWTDPSYCGLGEIWTDDTLSINNPNNNGAMFSVVYMGSAVCASSLVATHEIGHNLGGTQSTAPRHDSQNPAHPRDEYDILAYGSNTYVVSGCSVQVVFDKLFDCNDNDYFDPAPSGSEYLASHWNAANNRFLVGAAPI